MQELTDDQFYDALESQDALGLVIRAHIHIEHWATKFLESSLPQYKRFSKDLNADYDKKIILSCMTGLTSDLKAPLSAFGKLRNNFAHEPNYALTSTDADNIYASLSSKHKGQIQEAYKKLAITYKRKIKSYSKLNAEAKIHLLAMFLRSKLKKACAQRKGA